MKSAGNGSIETAPQYGGELMVERRETEVPEKAKRRTFTKKYKIRILSEADRCTKPGQIGALLRREGLYSSHLSKWRQMYRDGGEDALRVRKRGRPADPDSAMKRENERLRKSDARMREKLRQAELIIDAQKKLSEVLGLQLLTPNHGENE